LIIEVSTEHFGIFCSVQNAYYSCNGAHIVARGGCFQRLLFIIALHFKPSREHQYPKEKKSIIKITLFSQLKKSIDYEGQYYSS
jgi:hypothetical protein